MLEWARRAGIDAGLLDDGAPASKAVRNTLLYDSFADLRQGRRASALAKLAFGARSAIIPNVPLSIAEASRPPP